MGALTSTPEQLVAGRHNDLAAASSGVILALVRCGGDPLRSAFVDAVPEIVRAHQPALFVPSLAERRKAQAKED